MTSHSVDPTLLGHPPPEHVNMNCSENEDEVDQLDSEPDAEPIEPDASSVSSQKLGATDDSRIPGCTLLPSTRIENIIQAECVTGHLSMSKEALFVASIATEEFIKRLVQAGYRASRSDRRNVVCYRDMASTVTQYQELMFLEDTIPLPLPLHEALQRREVKEKEILEADPVMSTGASQSNNASLNHTNASKNRGKNRASNGKGKSDGSVSSVKKERKPKDVNGRWHFANGNMTETMGPNGIETTWSPWPDEVLRFRSPPLPAQNGIAPVPVPVNYPLAGEIDTSQLPAGRHPASAAPSRDDRMEYPPPTAPFQQSTFSQHEGWPGQYTGPASGFLRPQGPFGRIPANSGRTIYSQQHDTESSSFR